MTRLPDHIAEQLLSIGKVEHGRTHEQSDEMHVKDFANTLRITRESFGTEGDRYLHGVYLSGTATVLCHTGTSPNSSVHADIITGLWNHFVDIADAQQRDAL